jgi:secondary thiamine-phosphate synthase enzyme
MKIKRKNLSFSTSTQIEFVDITEEIQNFIEESGIREGMVSVYSHHTTMSVVINHNEPLLLQDFTTMLYRLSPIEDQYNHDFFELKKEVKSDGRSNGHSHCKNILLGSSEMIPVERGHLMLGERQSIFAVELDGSRKRDIIIQIMGE